MAFCKSGLSRFDQHELLSLCPVRYTRGHNMHKSRGKSMQDELEFTGERYMPDVGGNIFLEHMHRYRMALGYVAGKEVLDIASGEGFGSDLLATKARRVIGVDISEPAVEHARRRYIRDNLEFHVGSVTEIPLPADSVDVVVSFETIEHIDAHEAMLDEVRRVLRPGGVLIVSTPDKATYTDATGLTNSFHVRELYRTEFADLLSSRFRHVTLHGQRIGFGSVIACETGTATMREDSASTGASAEGLIDALYLIAVASDDPAAAPGLHSLFSQDIMASEPVLVRVKAELDAERERAAVEREAEREIMATQLAEREQMAERLAAERDQLSWQLAGHRRMVEELETEREQFTLQLAERDRRIKEMAEEQAALLRTIGPEMERWQRLIGALQAGNWQSRASTGRLVRRMLVSSLLYRLARVGRLSERRRSRFLKSAAKRDPLLLSKAVEAFSTTFFARIPPELLALVGEERALDALAPRVTAIVPNYNHAGFLKQRLESILAQTYPLVDIVILDDASTDDSQSIIAGYASLYPDRIRVILNPANSGSVFGQWRKGHEAATGDLVWFCESDDFCDPHFLARLLPAFTDPSVTLAFGRIQFADDVGNQVDGLDAYREAAEPGIWETRVKRPAHEWFAGAFGVKNLIANVGGSVWRRDYIRDEDWEFARSFRVMGDWYLYSVVAGGGQIAYEPEAVSYFRIHGDNTSGAAAQKRAGYYEEYVRLMTALKQRWPIPDATVDRFIAASRRVFLDAAPEGLAFDRLVPRTALLAAGPARPHILIGLLGFTYGGGELFPIHLANALHRRGVTVSMLQLTLSMDLPDVRRMLDPGIPVYTADEVRRMGIAAFVTRAGVSLVHSHIASVEMVMLDEGKVTLPYVATLHGSYEAMGIPDADVARWADRIDRLAYTADRNLEAFHRVGVQENALRKFRNAMPVDERPFPKTRAEMGIPESAIVYSLVARGEVGKGWPQAVRAFLELEARHPNLDLALLMVGTGLETDEARELAGDHPRIRFLGFQQHIHGLYRISDVALAPTRFKGESFPLCLIQAMQVGTPVIGTDIGEIRAMLESGDRSAGIILPLLEDDAAFLAEIVAAMERMLDPGLRAELAGGARSLGASYSMDALAEEYLELYGEVLAHHSSAAALAG